ncbi:hypothetical protein [Crenobacter cavernae]|uniref:Uncharacterized protein n=1 Tax=Crenobacter cavernae TaxID=2290923 RepID=A0ABY0FEA4_9NEIS|nr:hypothetical protein [Crenobacter cavernae]RXZ42684.1 hypothetical protein EBB06_12380 [Crenobacter cavernae]
MKGKETMSRSEQFSARFELLSSLPYSNRSDVLLKWGCYQVVHCAGWSVFKFADRLAECYHARVPDGARTIAALTEIRRDMTEVEYTAASGSNRMAVQRWLKGEVRFPVDLEEAWKDALDSQVHNRCVAELAEREGFVPLPVPAVGGVLCGWTGYVQADKELSEVGAAMASGASKSEKVLESFEALQAAAALYQFHKRSADAEATAQPAV